MNTLISQISQLIRSCHGHVYVTAGIISGFFDDPDDAKSCAQTIEAKFEADVDVCGCELIVNR